MTRQGLSPLHPAALRAAAAHADALRHYCDELAAAVADAEAVRRWGVRADVLTEVLVELGDLLARHRFNGPGESHVDDHD